jgi:hypothetical protein
MPFPISTTGQLVAIIRARLSSTQGGNSSKMRPAPNQTLGKSSVYRPENLEAHIALRIQEIGRDDPQRGRKAFRVFLESIVLTHFGEHLINDPKFYQLVDDIHMSMDNDPGIRHLVNSAIDHLFSLQK